MAGRIRVRAQLSDGVTEVKALMRHPMETGLRKDADGNAIPANFITEVTATHNDRVVMQAFWGASVSQNPFLACRFTGGAVGDDVTVNWVDNLGETGTGTTKIR
jgi:sulfur-oxidizing protein SoxZ